MMKCLRVVPFVLGLVALLVYWPVSAETTTTPLSGQQANTCFATPDDGATVFSAASAAAVQQAVDSGSASIKVAGYCPTDNANDVAIINQSITVSGGYTTTNWANPNSLLHPTVFDGKQSNGVFTISAPNQNVTLATLHITGGSRGYGGGVHASDAATLILRDLNVYDNSSVASGGGVWLGGGRVTIMDSTIHNNSSEMGGGVDNATILTIERSSITNNSAAFLGGGIHNSGTLQLTDSTLSGNQVTNSISGGAGIYNQNTLTMVNSTLSGNSAETQPTRSTADMLALLQLGTAGGGGLLNHGEANIQFSTIASNAADANSNYLLGGGIHNLNGGTLNMTATIVANNSGGDCVNRETLGTIADNLVEDGGCLATFVSDPNLEPLNDNGGPTETHQFAGASQAIDAILLADCAVAADQRGVARPINGSCDIGAVEVATASVCFATLDDGASVFDSHDASALQAAINAANSGRTVKVAGNCSGMNQAPDLSLQTAYIDKSITLIGGFTPSDWTTADPSNPTIFDALGLGRVVQVNGSTVTLENIVLQKGLLPSTQAGAGLSVNNATLTLNKVTVRNNVLTDTVQNGGSGAGIFADSSTLILSDSIVADNMAYGASGAGIYCHDSMLTLKDDSQLVGNVIQPNAFGRSGGGLYVDGGSAEISNTTIENNHAAANGGGIANSGIITLTDTIIDNNTVTTGGSGGGIWNTAFMTLNDITLTNNAVGVGTGGGLYNEGGTVFIADSTIATNSAGRGGGLRNVNTDAQGQNGKVTITNSQIISNSAGLGGGIENRRSMTITQSILHANSAGASGGGINNAESGDLSIFASTLSDNHAASFGGGIMNDEDAELIVRQSTLAHNQAQFGGGVYTDAVFQLADPGRAEFYNSTFSGNQAADSGGAVYASGQLEWTHVTASDNGATTGGGIYLGNNARGYLHNSLIANSGGSDCVTEPSALSILVSTLIEDGSCNAMVTGDPLLDILGNYGGATQTHALLPNSPAIDAGDAAHCVAEDQRGVTRPAGSCDIGAFEIGMLPTRVSVSSQAVSINQLLLASVLSSVALVLLTALVVRQTCFVGHVQNRVAANTYCKV